MYMYESSMYVCMQKFKLLILIQYNTVYIGTHVYVSLYALLLI